MGVVSSACAMQAPLPAPLPAAHSAADPDGLSLFAKDYDVNDIRISPLGTYFAVMSDRAGVNAVAFLSTETKEVVGGYRLTGHEVISSLAWASDKRVVLSIAERAGPLDQRKFYGDLIAVNVDGSNQQTIFGYRAARQQTGTRIKKAKATYGWGYLIDPLWDDDQHVLVYSRPFQSAYGEGFTTAFRVNIFSGLKEKEAVGPGFAMYYVTDENGRVRAAVSAEKGGTARPYVRTESGDWTPLADSAAVSSDARPVGFSAQQNTLFLVDEPSQEIASLFSFDAETRQRAVVSSHEMVQPTAVLTSRQHGGPVAVRYEPDYSTWTALDKADATAQLIERLSNQYAEHRVSVRSQTRDGQKIVVLISSDRDPGTFYLVDVRDNTMSALLRRHESVVPKDMRPMEAFRIKARDGLVINGYLTTPAGSDAEAHPLVVMPHGGPHGVRDYWGFDREVQMFASQGFAVLQVNFRGSGGYGASFISAGYGQWGDAIQNDVIDAIRWAIAQKVADPKRICTYGGSFGGYSAVQLAIRAPDLVRCAVGFAGIYDLARLNDEGDLSEFRWGRDVTDRFTGTDRAALVAQSPTHNADKIEAPVLLVHGEDDRRAPISHARGLCDALKKHNKPCETLFVPNEGHGFRSEANRLQRFRRMLAFLRQHTGPSTPALSPSATR